MPNFTLVNFYKNYGGVSEIYMCVCESVLLTSSAYDQTSDIRAGRSESEYQKSTAA